MAICKIPVSRYGMNWAVIALVSIMAEVLDCSLHAKILSRMLDCDVEV